MVEFTVLASGSKGNSAVLTAGSTRIVLDAGLSARELCRRMLLAEIDPKTLDAILITHEHSDHIQGMAVLSRKLGIPVYLTAGTHAEWQRLSRPRTRTSYTQWLADYRALKSATETAETVSILAAASETEITSEPSASLEPASPPNPEPSPETAAPTTLPQTCFVRPGEPLTLGEFTVHPFTIPHDAADPVGYVFCAEGVRIAVATDLGYVPPNVAAQLQRCDLLMLESNHDPEMLRDGPYPWSVKQRVLSRVGHLSNEAAAEFLEQGWDGQAACVILAHLSESNNLPALAHLAASRALASHPSASRQLLLAAQDQPLAPIRF